jgi:N,N'-diacetyl-8-epilegionaminate cytidylyltransferase
MSIKENVIGFIFCRGGSKQIPRKNLMELAGKPLIAHSIDTAFDSQLVNRVIVSTDDEEIAEVAKKYGAEVPFIRPKALAQDDSPEIAAWQHAVKFVRCADPKCFFDVFVSIPATSPLRDASDIDSCIKLLQETSADLVVSLRQASRNPYFNMLEKDKQGRYRLLRTQNRPIVGRQYAPEIFELTTVAYAARPDYVLTTENLFDGKIEGYVVPEERALDIDSYLDLEFAEFLMSKR